ncbi:excalibur calcium-binding domain-containing protein [Silicimonas algicola]|uniref:excalibur calcium-binding domain-containing protein n=2 Tax=Silicimonas algicola TaxID=1826607 RepID=UPI000D6BD920|nr:excalibur calcium-binding domain-containing protein [Silicimonas algicola]
MRKKRDNISSFRRAQSARSKWATPQQGYRRRRFPRRYLRAICVVAIISMLGWKFYVSQWPAWTTVRHMAAAPNCDFARMVGLAPSNRGQPGYYPRHDRNQDGVACEPFVRRFNSQRWR